MYSPLALKCYAALFSSLCVPMVFDIPDQTRNHPAYLSMVLCFQFSPSLFRSFPLLCLLPHCVLHSDDQLCNGGFYRTQTIYYRVLWAAHWGGYINLHVGLQPSCLLV